MMKRLRVKSNQKGFSLVEVIVATALTGIIAGVMGPITYDILWHSDRSSAQIETVSNIEEAARWISNDGQRAQDVDFTTDPANPELIWTDPDTGDVYEITYSKSGTGLYRSESINSGSPSARIIASYIDSFSFTTSSTESFKVSLTSTAGDSAQLSETREYYVTRRAIY